MCIRPVIVPDQQQYFLSQAPEVFPVLVNLRHSLGDLKLQSIPIVDLREQVQQVAGQKKNIKN